MTQLIINVGASANDGLGDPLRTSFTYCNSNFSELFSRVQTTPPTTLIGVPGDQAGMYAFDSTYFYYCFADFDGVDEIWNKALTISEPGNYGNANVATYLNGSAGNIVPANTGVQSLGNSVNTFKNVFLSNSTIYLNSVPVTTLGNTLLVNGSNVVVASSIDNSVTVTGNISGNYFIGNGSQLTGINANYSNANVADYLPIYSGNLAGAYLSAVGNVRGGNLKTLGLLSAAGNVTGGNILTAGKISATGPISVGVYTATNLGLVTGTVGSLAAVSDSPTVGGRLAFWDTTNSRWSYVSDNSAV